MMISVADFLAIASGQSDADVGSSVKLATIDPAYVSGDPKVTFDGESTLSGRGYVTLNSYDPQPSERVLLIRTGNTWLIVGAIGDFALGSLGSRLTQAEDDITALKKGWNYLDHGVANADFTVDITKGGVYPAGTFHMIKFTMSPIMSSGNSWIVGTVNNLVGATDYQRGWWGESFDGITTKRKVSNDGSRAVFGYISAQTGSSLELTMHRTNFASEIPMRGFSNRGAPSGFDGNREWMHAYSSMNANTLLSSVQFFISSGSISRAEWYAEGFRV